MIHRMRFEFSRHLVHPVNPVSKTFNEKHYPQKCTPRNYSLNSFHTPIPTRSVSEEEVQMRVPPRLRFGLRLLSLYSSNFWIHFSTTKDTKSTKRVYANSFVTFVVKYLLSATLREVIETDLLN
jgi:hypothetical protein